MISNALIQQMDALMRRQLTAANALYQILKTENTALVEHAHDDIRESTRLKDEKSTELEGMEQELNELLRAAGISPSKEALDAVLKAAPPSSAKALGQLREDLTDVLQACQEQNLVNGQIIAVSRQSAETALAILRGQLPTGNLTYGASGKPVSDPSRQPISKA